MRRSASKFLTSNSLWLKSPQDLAILQESSSFFLDRWRNWFVPWSLGLGATNTWGTTFHCLCPRILCSLWWHRQRKLDRTFLQRRPSCWSSLLLWLPDHDRKCSFRNIFSSHWYLHQRSYWKGSSLWGNWDHTVYQTKSRVGSSLDFGHSLNLCRAVGRICRRRRNLFLRFFCCNFLDQEERTNAWLNFLQWTYQSRWGHAYRFCMPLVFSPTA